MLTTQKSKIKMQNHNSKLKTEFKTDVKLRAYRFSLDIIKFTANFPNQKVYWVIGDQVLRSATSIGANIVEAKSSSSKREFIKFFDIALKSANETKYWLCLLRDSELSIDKAQVKELLQEAIEISNMLA
ncbi:MAG: four helix bundle protein, partial [Candidatus Jacksonbacteria bacterium]